MRDILAWSRDRLGGSTAQKATIEPDVWSNVRPLPLPRWLCGKWMALQRSGDLGQEGGEGSGLASSERFDHQCMNVRRVLRGHALEQFPTLRGQRDGHHPPIGRAGRTNDVASHRQDSVLKVDEAVPAKRAVQTGARSVTLLS